VLRLINHRNLTQIWKTYEKQERHIVPKGTSNKRLVLFATNILSLSGQTRVSLGTTCLEKNCPQKALGGVSKGIFNRKVRQDRKGLIIYL